MRYFTDSVSSSLARRVPPALTLLLAAAAVKAQPAPPVFVCPTVSPAPAGTVNDVGTVLNTTAVSEADRGNQPRWEAAIGASGFPNPLPSTVPSNLTFGYLSGTEIANYVGGLSAPNSLAQVGFYPYPTGFVAPATMYFRYRFQLDPTVDPATYLLTLNGIWADDTVTAIYMNGVRWTGNATPALPTTYANTAGSTATLGGGSTTAQQWKAGANEVTLLVYDSGGAAVRLRVASSSAQCPSGPVAITIAPAPTVTLAQPVALSGTTSGLADGTQITVTVVGTDGVPHDYPATVTGGAWSVTVPAGTLPAGSYDVKATTPSGLPATAQGTVLAPVLAPAPLPATIGPSETVNLSGTLTNVPVGTPVTIELAGPGGSVQTFTTQTTDAAGNYGPVPAGPLAPGSYTATTSATGVTPQQQTFSVVAPAVPVLSPTPLPATVGPSDNVDLSGTLTNVPAGTTVTITITGPNGFTRTLTATTDGAGAYGPVPAGTLPAGDYTVTTTAAGVAPVAQTLAVRAAAGAGAVQAVPTLGTWALGLLGLLLAGVAGWRRRFQ